MYEKQIDMLEMLDGIKEESVDDGGCFYAFKYT